MQIKIPVCEMCNSDSTYPHQCSGCKRFICADCQADWNYYKDEPYCNKCWAIGEEHRYEIEVCEKTILDLEEAWGIACSM